MKNLKVNHGGMVIREPHLCIPCAGRHCPGHDSQGYCLDAVPSTRLPLLHRWSDGSYGDDGVTPPGVLDGTRDRSPLHHPPGPIWMVSGV